MFASLGSLALEARSQIVHSTKTASDGDRDRDRLGSYRLGGEKSSLSYDFFLFREIVCANDEANEKSGKNSTKDDEKKN